MSATDALGATADLSALATPHGVFAMLAIDQRVSLETMFQEAGRELTTVAMDVFRADVLRYLAPAASAVLVERGLVQRGRLPDLPGPPPGRILAAEHLQQEPGHGATGSTVDMEAPGIAAGLGAQALKLMVVWSEGSPLASSAALVREFIALAHGAGRLAVVEVIVRGAADSPTPAGYVAGVAALGAGADLLKVQPPTFAGDDVRAVADLSRAVTGAVACPWVMLSTGVAPARLGEVLTAACRGGASGFLAGRGIWGDALTATDPAAFLRSTALERLIDLAAIAEAHGRPWWTVGRDPAAA